MSGPDRVLVFARFPIAGQCKTRLIPWLGPVGAAAITERLTSQTLGVAAPQQGASWTTTILVDGATPAEFSSLFDRPSVRIRPQPTGHLGQRLSLAVDQAFADGSGRLVIIGTDCPSLRTAHLQAAFAALEQCDVVFGPALDGGYYLIGLKHPQPSLFEQIDWSTDRVYVQSLAQAQGAGLSVRELPALGDLDLPCDLPRLQRLLPVRSVESATGSSAHSARLSVIIPTRNEAAVLEATLQRVRGGLDVDLIVVDGGSQDATVEIARQFGARVLVQSTSRATRLNAGAAAAVGSQLLFLHADTLLPANYEQIVRDGLSDPEIALGAFRLQIRSADWKLRTIARGANWRTQALGLPYGDQALFVRAETFWKSGGFRPLPLMDDFDWAWRLRQYGRCQLMSAAVETSDRRWRRLGPVRTTVLNQLIVSAWWLGVPPDRLADWYRGRRG